MIRMEFAKRIEEALPRLACVTAAIAMATLLALAGCATEEAPAGAEAPAPEAAEEAPEQDVAGTPAESEQEAQAPETEPAVSALESYSWDELSRISAEIAAAEDEDAAIEVAKQYELCTPDGRLDGTQVKSVTLSDGTQTTVQIVGFAHDNKTEGGKAGITFVFGDAIGKGSMNSSKTNAGGWEASQMRAYLNGDWRAQLPEDLDAAIVPVDKLTNNVGETQDVSAVTATSDSLWLFSVAELDGAIEWYRGDNGVYNEVLNAEGVEYKLFRDTADPSRPNEVLEKNFQGSEICWWARSPRPANPSGFQFVVSGAVPDADWPADTSYGVVPGFCI